MFALIGQLCTFIALNVGQISVVAPLINTTPLFVIALSALFLCGEEKITPMVLVGVVLLVAGIGFINRQIDGLRCPLKIDAVLAVTILLARSELPAA